MSRWIVAIIASALFGAGAAGAGELLSSIPNFNDDPLFSWGESVALDRACLVLPSSDLGLPCNAAFFAGERFEQFRINGFVNQDISTAVKHRSLLLNEDHVGFVNEFVKDQKPTLAQGFGTLWYQDGPWAIIVTPYKIDYALKKVNGAFTEFAGHVREGTELAIGGGIASDVEPRFKLGLWTRFQQAKYYRGETTVLDAVNDPEIIEIHSSHAILMEPSIVYDFSPEWHSQFIAALAGGAVYYDGTHEGRPHARGDIGMNFAPPMEGARIRLGIQANVLGSEAILRRVRFSSLLESHYFNLAFAVSLGEVGVHLSTAIDSLVLGVGYKLMDYSDEPHWGHNSVQNFMCDVGLRF